MGSGKTKNVVEVYTNDCEIDIERDFSLSYPMLTKKRLLLDRGARNVLPPHELSLHSRPIYNPVLLPFVRLSSINGLP